MWLQMIFLAAALSVAQGMCFGAPLLQPQVTCPDTMVYYPQLCICLEPKHKDRLHEIVDYRKVPMLTNAYVDPSQTFKNKLYALRHRLTASLPDMGSHGYGSSVGDVRTPLIIFPDRLIIPNSPFNTMSNHVPRSWRIGGLLESWPHEALRGGAIPTVNSGDVYSRSSSGWGPNVDDMTTLSLMERLHIMRSLWRDASHGRAGLGLEDTALAQEFFKHLPTTGISPDTPRSFFQFVGVPDIISVGVSNGKTAPEIRPKPLLSLKKTELVKRGLAHILPKQTARRTNSYLRSATRLKSAAVA